MNRPDIGPAVILALALAAAPAFAEEASEEFSCEVIAVEGQATRSDPSGSVPLKDGDFLLAGQTVRVEKGGLVDLAFDGEWQNTVRLESDTELSLSALHPDVALELGEGDVFTELDALPQGSTFELTTPTATASVRGTAWHTEHRGGQTQIASFKGDVEVLSAKDRAAGAGPVRLGPNQRTSVAPSGALLTPQPLRESDRLKGERLLRAVDARRKDLTARGRVGKLPRVAEIEKRIRALGPRPGREGRRSPGRPEGGPQGPVRGPGRKPGPDDDAFRGPDRPDDGVGPNKGPGKRPKGPNRKNAPGARPRPRPNPA
jgi:hypothetical protein